MWSSSGATSIEQVTGSFDQLGGDNRSANSTISTHMIGQWAPG